LRFAEVLSRRIGLLAIAEVKRRSPSAGDLRPGADPAELARAFERAGAAAVSILVDERFGGTIDDLRAARRKVTLPLLAKGFFSTPDQLRELREAGADAVLLILRDLDDQTIVKLMQTARALELDVLVEAHDEEELQRAVALDATVIGINARDLSTFELDRATQLELVAKVPPGRIAVAESGISSRAQGAAAELAGAKAILVGSTLMRAPDPAAKLAEILSRPLVKVCGLTREEDVAVAAEAGADMAGFILAAESPRRTDDLLPVPETMLSVAVHVGEYEERGADLIQLYRRENGHRSRDGELLSHGREVAFVVDLPWEGADPDHFQFARSRSLMLSGRLMLAGRLGPDNVREAIEVVQPWAVDAASRLEVEPGIKDHELVRAYVEAAR
jgi:indole-3-glycerol phosphate synthase/phosphoribosylanthranilate isomerase